MKRSRLHRGVAYYRDRADAERILEAVKRVYPDALLRDFGLGHAVQYRNSDSYYPDRYGDLAADLAKNPLSDAQREALTRMLQCPDGTIRYLKGGWWITESTPIDDRGVPAWSAIKQTIRALEDRGLVRPSAPPSSNPGIDPRELTVVGRFAAEHG